MTLLFLVLVKLLLVPDVISLSASEIASLVDNQKQLSDFGFCFKEVSPCELELTYIPSLLVGKDVQSLFVDLACYEPKDENTKSVFSNILATIACHSAVRAGDQLVDEELKVLLAQAENVDFYHNCPHGRRVLRWFTLSEIKKWFDRL